MRIFRSDNLDFYFKLGFRDIKTTMTWVLCIYYEATKIRYWGF